MYPVLSTEITNDGEANDTHQQVQGSQSALFLQIHY